MVDTFPNKGKHFLARYNRFKLVWFNRIYEFPHIMLVYFNVFIYVFILHAYCLKCDVLSSATLHCIEFPQITNLVK